MQGPTQLAVHPIKKNLDGIEAPGHRASHSKRRPARKEGVTEGRVQSQNRTRACSDDCSKTATVDGGLERLEVAAVAEVDDRTAAERSE